MSSLSVSVTSPAPLTQIPQSRQITVSGTFALTVSPGYSIISRSISATFGVGPPVQGTVGTSTWTVSGTLPASIGPNTNFDVVVSGHASLRDNSLPGEPIDDSVSASTRITLRSPLPRPPNLAIDPIASPIVTDSPPVNVRFSGTASGVDGPIAVVRYLVDGGVPGQAFPVNSDTPGYANWSVTLPVPPGPHTFTARAIDQFGTTTEVVRSFTVEVQPPIVVPPGSNTTLSGAPTTSSVTSWTRLEPRSNGADIGTSSSARIFDPLWLLTRQWQMGEFQAEDAGTPVQARVRATNAKLTRLQLGKVGASTAPIVAYDAAAAPLEAIVERRRMRSSGENDPRMLTFAIEAGLHFLRMLELAGLSRSYRAPLIAKLALRQASIPSGPLVDADTQRYVASMIGRAPDGRRLAAILASQGAAQFVLDPALGIAAADRPKVQQAANAWQAWHDGLYCEPAGATEDAWDASRLEYNASVGARLSTAPADELIFSAGEIDGSPLDWSSFDVTQGSLGTSADQGFTSLVEATVPTPLSFHGLPAARFWELEDSTVAYGLTPVGPADVVQLMAIEYASSYGNDWFVVPLTLPVGSVTRVDSLVVTDSFGVRSLVRSMGDPALPAPHCSLWQSSYRTPPADSSAKYARNCFFLPPTLGRTLESAPLEDVLLLRDEMANLAWAIERTIENGIEQPHDRRQTTDTDSANVNPEVPADMPRYILASAVPVNWVPLLPVQTPHPSFPTDPRQALSRLQRGAVLQPDGSQIVHAAQGEILSASASLQLYDEEVPREGAMLTRRRRMARWSDGSTWLWTSLRNDVGRGEGSSGLQFDQVVEPTS